MRVQPPATQKKKKRIGRLLIEAGIIEPDQLKEALTVQKHEGGKTVEILIRLGYLEIDDISKFLSEQPGIPSIELANYQVASDICGLIPRDFAIENEVFPIDRLGKLLTVGMAFPLDSATIGKMEEMTGLKVKALLCRKQDIQNAIRQHYGNEVSPPSSPPAEVEVEVIAEQIETSARLEGVAQLVRGIDSLPTLPQTVQRVRQAAASPDVSMKDIAAIVQQDPPISAKLLKLANSAAYGFAHRIDNVHMATALLGLDETCLVVTSSAVVNLTEKSRAFDHERFWRESTFCAASARYIASACGIKKESGLFTAGLLCDIGRFALAEAAPKRYAKIDPRYCGNELKLAEEEILGVGHPEAGYLLATHWQMPTKIAEPIRFHHDPELATEHAPLVAVVSLAARMTQLHYSREEPDSSAFESDGPGLALLRLSPADAWQLFRELAATR